VYSSLKITNLLSILQPLRDAAAEGAGNAHLYEEEQMEAFIMTAARTGDLNIRVDHALGELTFIDEPFSGLEDQPIASSSRENSVQPSVSTLVRTRLSTIATTLHNTLQVLDPPPVLTAEEQQERVATLVAAAQVERSALQLRLAIVARRRELLSELSVRKEKEEASRRAEKSRVQAEEERKRSLEAARKRDIERARMEIQKKRDEEARQLAQSLKDRGNLKVNIDVRLIILCFLPRRMRADVAVSAGHGQPQHGQSHAAPG
jgi:translation initiation factor 3 subunit A